jgi:2-keto-4-pentenoate hydratase
MTACFTALRLRTQSGKQGLELMTTDAFLERLAHAIRDNATLPEFPPGVTLDDAYRLLPKLTERVSSHPHVGLKAGLTNVDLQQLFSLEEPLLGLLYDSCEIRPGDVMSFSPHRLIECEMCVTYQADGRPIAVGPAVEFVSVKFAKPEDMTPGNLTLCNLGADKFMKGEMTAWEDFDFDALGNLEIVATRNGETILKTTPLESLGGPVTAHEWCIGKAKSLGFTLPQHGILLAGTNGSALPAEPGNYDVHYGHLGTISFSISAA